MSRRENFKRKNKAAKLARRRREDAIQIEASRKRFREEQLASGLPKDVFLLHKLLG